MPTFALRKIEQVKGNINFYQLEIDGRSEFNEFCEALEQADERKILNTIYATMDSVANLKFLPKTKFRELKGRKANDTVKDYEIKKDAIRIYLFKDIKGNIVVCSGSKNSQKEDIARMRRIKKEYLNSK